MLEEIKEATLKAGKLIIDAEKTYHEITSKEGSGEYVTQWDLAIQNMLKESLLALCPEAGFLGEEGSETPPELESGWCFIVDPIDGTSNFIRNYRHSSVSVALSFKQEIIFGAVCNPYQNELFYAEKGKGAFCNGTALGLVRRPLEKSIVIFGTSNYDRCLANPTFTLLRSLFDKAEDLRCSGSAALDICYIASGRCDIFFEYRLCPWDYAAGSLILMESGYIIEAIDGKAPPLTGKSSIIAASPFLLDEIKALGLLSSKGKEI